MSNSCKCSCKFYKFPIFCDTLYVASVAETGACPGIRKRGAQNLKPFFFFFAFQFFRGGGAQLRN